MKRYLSVLLVLAMVLSLFAGVSFAEGEKRVLTFAGTGNNADEMSTEIFKRIEEEMNIEIKYIQYTSDALAAVMSSGDLPDVVFCHSDLPNYLQSGLMLDIEPYIDQYAPNMRNDTVSLSLQILRDFTGDGEHLYVIPPCIGLESNAIGGSTAEARGYIVRWDWYKELGCPEINNDEDYLNVLLQMLENHPTTENGDKTLLYGCERNYTDMGGYRACFLSNIALCPWTGYRYKSDLFSNKVVDCFLDVENSHYYTDMAFYNKIYRLGLWDEDNFTETYDEYKAKVAAGRYCGLYFKDDALFNEKRKTDPETTIGYVSVPSKNAVQFVNRYAVMGNVPNQFSFIWKDSKNIDLAMTFFNYMYDLDFMRYAYSGEQGVTWDYDENGVPHMFEEALTARRNGESYWSTSADCGGHGTRLAYCFGYNTGVLASDGYPLDLNLTYEAAITSQTSLMADVAATYGVEYWVDAYTSLERDFRNECGQSISSCVSAISADDLRVIAYCDELWESNMATLIMAESEEEYNEALAALLAELEAAGEAEVFARYEAEWNKVREVMVPAHHQAVKLATGLDVYPEE